MRWPPKLEDLRVAATGMMKPSLKPSPSSREAKALAFRAASRAMRANKAGRPHYGVDLAAPVGTPIVAPAPGLVVLAEPALHFEGGLTLIDHGQGLIGMFLHQSRQFVTAGERVERGQRIGLVGQTGRATGPHLCWRLKWRAKNMDPSLMVGPPLNRG